MGRTKFLEVGPACTNTGSASGIGVMIVPGAGWGASALREAAAPLAAAGHAIVLCDPCGSAPNPGPFSYDALARDCAAHADVWDVRRIVLLAHSMGTHTAAKLARLDARIEQVWVAPVLNGRSTFESLHAAGEARQFHQVLFESPLAAKERSALDALSSGEWLQTPRFDALEKLLALPSRGGVRVPNVWDFLREVAHPGYTLAIEDAVRLRGVLVPRDDGWVTLGVSQTFCGAAGVPLHILSRGRGHAVSGGWSEVLETVRSWLDGGSAYVGGSPHGIA